MQTSHIKTVRPHLRLGILALLAASILMPLASWAGSSAGSRAARHAVRTSAHVRIHKPRRVRSRARWVSARSKRRWHRRRVRRVRLPKAPDRERTAQIQTALGRGGYYQGEPTGKWDARTEDALRRFQQANGLPPTGKLDALSLQKMGLGSDTAGIYAPRPTVPLDPPTAESHPPRR